MAFRCGTDIVYIPRIKQLLEKDEVVKKFFHQSELSNTDPEHLARIIAAKEAFFKALGTIPRFTDIEITYEESGRPMIRNNQNLNCDVSISHDGDYATAIVILEK